MPKYIIKWNAGYGDSYDEVEAENEEKALEYAYESWKEEVEANADYDVIGEWTEELAEDYL
jgi:hypothetical protein